MKIELLFELVVLFLLLDQVDSLRRKHHHRKNFNRRNYNNANVQVTVEPEPHWAVVDAEEDLDDILHRSRWDDISYNTEKKRRSFRTSGRLANRNLEHLSYAIDSSAHKYSVLAEELSGKRRRRG